MMPDGTEPKDFVAGARVQSRGAFFATKNWLYWADADQIRRVGAP